MLELFTERGRRAITLAQDLASEQRSPTVSAKHLLGAVLGVDGGQIARAALGVSEAQARQIRTEAIDEPRVALPSSVGLAPVVKRVMLQAAQQALEAESKVDVSHLVIQLLSIDDAAIDQMLTSLGVDREDAYRRANDQRVIDERRPHARLPRREI